MKVSSYSHRFFVLVYILIFTSAAFAAPGYVVVEKYDTIAFEKKTTKTLTLYISDLGMRTDEDNKIFIYKKVKGEGFRFFDLNVNNKTYMNHGNLSILAIISVLALVECKPVGLGESMKQKCQAKPDYFKPTGKTKKVNGYMTNVVIAEIGGLFKGIQSTLYNTNDHKLLTEATLKRYDYFFNEMEKAGMGMFNKQLKQTVVNITKKYGVTIASKTKIGNLSSGTMTVVSVVKKDIPANMYDIPSDYKKVATPWGNIPNLPPNLKK